MRSAVAATGLIMQACGLALRVWSKGTLGSFYTRTLRTTQDQHVVDTGPYFKPTAITLTSSSPSAEHWQRVQGAAAQLRFARCSA
jgi:hypothetical protein